ncbi:MAG: hypothetical protein ACYTXC_01075 [Nostoc sp.]
MLKFWHFQKTLKPHYWLDCLNTWGKVAKLSNEVASIWAEEAELRDQEMDSGKLSSISMDDGYPTA